MGAVTGATASLNGRMRRVSAVLAAVTVLVTGAVVGAPEPAQASDYPSWNDVLAARDNEARTQAEVTRIEKLLTDLQADVEAKELVAKEKGDEYFEAQQAFDEAAFRAQQLQEQADAAQATADESMLQAGQMAARTQRIGGTDITATLLFGEGANENLLAQLGLASKVGEQSSGVFAKARQDQNTAQSLTDQANVAKAALGELAAIAEEKMREAQAAADAAADALAAQQEHQARLRAQLATLTEDRVATEEEYTAGIRAMWGDGAAGEVSPSGWARPAPGYVSSGFGPRIPPTAGASSFHAGIDLAPPCNAPIFAAHMGTVVYAGWNGGYGYFVRIDHGNGLTTSYGHIVAGGVLVHNGQRVGPGQQIARVGTTGTSTGCHLHFELRQNGYPQNPLSHLRGQGVNI